MKSKISVLLVDDHQMMREGLRMIIEEEEDLSVVAEASSGDEALQLIHELKPNVVVIDVNMLGLNGIEATKKIMEKEHNTCIIGLSLHDNPNISKAMKNAGACAYLNKTEATVELCEIIRRHAVK